MDFINGKVLPRCLEQEMRESYIDYSMSVIVGRALPDVRDGLKPVHRRILYSMYEQGITPDKPHKNAPVSSVTYLVNTIPTAIPPYTMRWYVWRRASRCAICWPTARATSVR